MPKKSLGQHFLKDQSIVRWIIGEIPKDSELTIEIGPGKGALTKHLSSDNSILFELDDDLVELWKKNGFNVVPGDSVQTIPEVIPNYVQKKITVISNLPYNASSQIFIELIKQKIPTLVLMFQKEVAEKIIANHGDRNFGRLSLITKIFYDVKKSKSVAPKAFYPPPNVWSKVIVLHLRPEPLVKINNFRLLEEVVKGFFQFPRKKIKATGVQIEGISDKRPHELQESDWLKVLSQCNF